MAENPRNMMNEGTRNNVYQPNGLEGNRDVPLHLTEAPRLECEKVPSDRSELHSNGPERYDAPKEYNINKLETNGTLTKVFSLPSKNPLSDNRSMANESINVDQKDV